jgi:prolyl-tRNA synthetase
MMGGLGAHEYMAPCAAGEDEVVLGEGYAANIEAALTTPGVEKQGEEYFKDGERLTLEPAIEIANIFKLGTRYSEPLGATYVDEAGAELPIWMACYGIGPARIVAAAVEQFADEHGICWPKALAPFAVHLVALGKPGTPEREAADGLYATLLAGGVEVLYDDRDLGPGEKFAEAELLGCPLRLTVGRKSLESDEVEVQLRRGRQSGAGIPLNGEPAEILRAVDEWWRVLPGGWPRPTSAPRPGPLVDPSLFAGCSVSIAPVRPRRRSQPASRCAPGRCPTRSASRGSR